MIFVGVLLYASYRLYSTPEHWIFMSYVNLIFHEAGHVLLIWAGEIVHALGGSIFEVLVPTMVTVHFLFKRNLFAAGFGLWWLSTALYSVAVYAGDARERALPLITGDANTHDWWFVLLRLGWLRYDDLISGVLAGMSLALLCAALGAFGLYFKRGWRQTV